MDNNKKLINLANLAKLSKSLDDRCKDSVNEVKSSVDEAKAEFVSEIARVEAMLGGRSIRYVTQDEYDALSPAEKNSDTVVYFVTDDMGDDGIHDHDDLYFTKEEINALLAALPDNDHTHDEYYTTTTIDSMLSNKSDKDHEHSDYATKDEVEALGSNVDKELAKKADKSEIPSLENYYNKNDVDGIKKNLESTIAGEVAALTSAIGGKANEGHNHDTLYHTKEYINANFYTRNDIDSTVNEINADKADKADLASYYTKTEVNGIKDDILEVQEELSTELDKTKTELANHKHDDDYYTKNEINTKFNNVAEKEHDHDDVYATKDEVEALETNYGLQLDNKADKSELSRFDNYYNITQVDGFVSNIESNIAEEVSTLNGAIATAKTNAINSAKSYTDTAVSNLVDSAPEAMNTLNELAEAIKNHNDEYTAYVATVASNIATAKAEAIADAAAKDTALHTTITTEINGKIEDINESISNNVSTLEGKIETAKAEAIAEAAKKDTALHTTISAEIDADVKAEADRAKAAEEGLQAKFDSLDTSFENHNHDDKYYTESEIDTKIAGINTTIETQVAKLTGNIATAKSQAITEAGKLDAALKTQLQAEIDADVKIEKERAENKEAEIIGQLTADKSALMKEINDLKAALNPEVKLVSVTGNTLTLTADKYQKCMNMVDGVQVVFPSVTNFTEIHLYFTTEIDLNLDFPECKWRVDPNIEEGKSYEIIAIYNTIEWLVNVIVYS